MNKYGRGPVQGEEKNGYVPLGTYQNINLDNFFGGPVNTLKKIPYSNFLGRTSTKKHPVQRCLENSPSYTRSVNYRVFFFTGPT